MGFVRSTRGKPPSIQLFVVLVSEGKPQNLLNFIIFMSVFRHALENSPAAEAVSKLAATALA